MTTIPTDHLMPATVGRTPGFHGLAAQVPPRAWEWAHNLGERGGYLRVGRSWVAGHADFFAPVRAMPTRVLYRLLIERVTRDGASAMGYTVDA